MKNQLNYLSNDDILEVYQKYIDKGKTIQANKPPQSRGYQQHQLSTPSIRPMPMAKDPWLDEPIKKYPISFKNTVKMEPRLGYNHNQAHQG